MTERLISEMTLKVLGFTKGPVWLQESLAEQYPQAEEMVLYWIISTRTSRRPCMKRLPGRSAALDRAAGNA